MAKKNNYRPIQPKIEPKIEPKVEPKVEPKSDIYEATTDVFVRESPNLSSRSISINKKGKKVEIDSIENGWLKLKSGGYSKAEYYTKL